MRSFIQVFKNCINKKIIVIFASLIVSLDRLILISMFPLIITIKRKEDIIVLLYVLLFFIFGEFFNIFVNYSLEKHGEKHKKVLKLNMLKSFENIELKEFESVNFKNKIFVINNYIENYIKISKDCYKTLINLFLALFVLLIIFYINVYMFIIYLFVIAFVLYLKNNQLKASKDIWIKYMENCKEHNIINNILIDKKHSNERKIFNVFNFYNKIFLHKYDDAIDENLKDARNRLKFDFLYEVSNYFLVLFMLIASLYLYNLESINISYFYLLNSGLIIITEIIGTELNKISDYFNFTNGINLYHEFITKKKLVKKDVKLSNYNMEFDRVFFRYPNSDEYIIKNFSFTFEFGKNYSILGRNGSGKSTLIKLLLGLYRVEKGNIRIGGVDINDISLEQKSKIFSVLFQHPKKYPFTIFENITLEESQKGDLDIDKSIVEFVENFNDGIDSYTSINYKNNVNLSGGQWKNIFFNRVFLRKSKVFIFDEPTSNLDPFLELEYYKNIQDKISGSLNIFISHRLGIVKYTDIILLIEDGDLIESGTHNELISYGGKYFEMYEIQKSIFD